MTPSQLHLREELWLLVSPWGRNAAAYAEFGALRLREANGECFRDSPAGFAGARPAWGCDAGGDLNREEQFSQRESCVS